MKIGVIGLGNMGTPMARRLMDAGHEVTVWNRSAAKADPLVAAGARRVDTPAGAAEGEIVLSMLADDRAVEAVTFGPDGILSAGGDAVHVGASTISLSLARRLAETHRERGRAYVSAPVSGRPPAAQAGKLVSLVAGDPAAIERGRPAWTSYSQRDVVLGTDPAAANAVKLAVNFMIMGTIEMLGEAMTLADAHGVGRAAFQDVLMGSVFASPLIGLYGQQLVDEAFAPGGFTAPLALKDMRLAGEAAEAARIPMPLLGIVRDRLLATIAIDGEEVDCGAAGRTVARAANR